MRVRVLAELVTDDGIAQWGYEHHEVVILPGNDAETNALTCASRMMQELDAAKLSVGEQAATETPKIAAEVAELTQFEEAARAAREELGRHPGS